MIIKNESQLLPHRVDPFTVLTEVTRKDNVIILNYQVTGLPPELFREEKSVNKMQGILTGKYCQDSAIMRLWQLAFPSGLQHNYFSDGTRVMQINIKPSDYGAQICQCVFCIFGYFYRIGSSRGVCPVNKMNFTVAGLSGNIFRG
ncbi:hypothetical protein B9086_004570 [Morganella morganii subsp. morganii]|nr:hypothetical protein [Morganella morganii]OFV04354.1 hypothetical protein HMPREF3119_00920 [Morganella sp. HMSC11D09]RNW14291.1 hypothetical protein B9086_004570 [Morganella morganii subsp. morganii]AMG70584.1 hypothetical protein AL531_09590 [Morganella morganii]AZP25041.1 hypothetical protein D8758_05895 [Morganella morganii]PCO26731.1 hypothetical protein CP987_16750 [Morganella morganii]